MVAVVECQEHEGVLVPPQEELGGNPVADGLELITLSLGAQDLLDDPHCLGIVLEQEDRVGREFHGQGGRGDEGGGVQRVWHVEGTVDFMQVTD